MSLGCSDPTALNYNCAMVNDGSCIYPTSGNKCSNAIPLAISTTGSACYPDNDINFTLFSFSGITPSCVTTPIYSDVWYTWNSGSELNLEFVSILSDLGIAVYRGSCGSLVEIDCVANGAGVLDGWNLNENLYFQVYSLNQVDPFAFLCLMPVCAPIVSLSSTCTGVDMFELEVEVSDFDSATGNNCFIPTAGDITCAFIEEGYISSCQLPSYTLSYDLWYTFSAPASGTVLIEVTDIIGGINSALFYSILQGSCGSFTEVTCGATSVGSASLTLTPFSTYYIRIGYLEDPMVISPVPYNEFTICLSDPNHCPSVRNDMGAISDGYYEVENVIYSEGSIDQGSDVVYSAGDSIVLNIGFDADYMFEAIIEGCD